jgi:hypothetical protein
MGIRPIGIGGNLAASDHKMHSSRSGKWKPKRPVELISFALVWNQGSKAAFTLYSICGDQ